MEQAAPWAAGGAALIGAGLGLLGLVAPQSAARIVRLQADPAFPDGVAEFRASFGGLFLAVHGLALAMLFTAGGAPTAFVCLTAAMIWLGTAFGRMVAILAAPPARSSYQIAATVFEAVLGLCLCAPMLAAQP